MKGDRIRRRSLKEEEFKFFLNRKLLTRPEVRFTNQLDIIMEWVTRRGGKPIKATHIGKRNTSIEIIEIDFSGKHEEFFKEIPWLEWYEVFKKNKLQFIYIEKNDNGRESRFYKICQ